MIFPRNCYFYCDTEAEVEELLQMLEADGLKWGSGARMTSKILFYGCRTYYRISNAGRVTYGSRVREEASWNEFSIDDARRFYAGDTSLCEVPSINDLL